MSRCFSGAGSRLTSFVHVAWIRSPRSEKGSARRNCFLIHGHSRSMEAVLPHRPPRHDRPHLGPKVGVKEIAPPVPPTWDKQKAPAREITLAIADARGLTGTRSDRHGHPGDRDSVVSRRVPRLHLLITTGRGAKFPDLPNQFPVSWSSRSGMFGASRPERACKTGPT